MLHIANDARLRDGRVLRAERPVDDNHVKNEFSLFSLVRPFHDKMT